MGKKPKSHSRYPSANKSGSSERKSSKDAPNLYSKTVASEDPRRAQNLLAGCIFDSLLSKVLLRYFRRNGVVNICAVFKPTKLRSFC